MQRLLSLFILPALLIADAETCFAADPDISGTLEKGLRILPVASNQASHRFKVYRGDYVKFRFDEKLGELAFEMPGMHYKETVFPDPEKSKLIKMTEAGTFRFTLGKMKGEMQVNEYQQANYQAISPSEAKELLKSIQPFILDVRTPGEFAQGHVKNARLLPVQELQSRHPELAAQKNQDVFIYCASGNRSTVAAKILIDQGFKRIYNLRGGFADLERQGVPIER